MTAMLPTSGQHQNCLVICKRDLEKERESNIEMNALLLTLKMAMISLLLGMTACWVEGSICTYCLALTVSILSERCFNMITLARASHSYSTNSAAYHWFTHAFSFYSHYATKSVQPTRVLFELWRRAVHAVTQRQVACTTSKVMSAWGAEWCLQTLLRSVQNMQGVRNPILQLRIMSVELVFTGKLWSFGAGNDQMKTFSPDFCANAPNSVHQWLSLLPSPGQLLLRDIIYQSACQPYKARGMWKLGGRYDSVKKIALDWWRRPWWVLWYWKKKK